jgi:hypothetical protein
MKCSCHWWILNIRVSKGRMLIMSMWKPFYTSSARCWFTAHSRRNLVELVFLLSRCNSWDVGGSGILCNTFRRGLPSAFCDHLQLPSGWPRIWSPGKARIRCVYLYVLSHTASHFPYSNGPTSNILRNLCETHAKAKPHDLGSLHPKSYLWGCRDISTTSFWR